MASITFEFLSRGADSLAADFGRVGDSAGGASRGAKVLHDVIDRLGPAENRTAEESRRLAAALRLTGDAADRAAAKVVVADAAIRRLADAEAEASRKAGSAGGGGIFSRLLGAASGAGGSGPLPLPGFLANPYAIAGIAAGVAALLPELVAVVSGFAAAGAGAGAFALLAAPAVKNVENAYASLTKAQQAYAAAQAKYVESPTKANATALANARLQLDLTRDSLARLPRSEQDAVTGLQGLVTQFGKLSAAFAPQAFRIFADLLKIADNLLPVVTPFATAFAGALDGILKQAAKFTGSQGFKDWLAQFQKLTGPSLTAIGEGIGHLVTSFGKLLTIFSAKDVVNAINIAFSVLDGTLIVLIKTTEFVKSAWDKLTAAFVIDRHEIANLFDGMRHDIANWGHNIASVFDESRANVARWALDVQRAADSVVKWFQALPGRITSALGNAATVLLSWGKGVIQGLLAGMTSVIGQVWDFVKNIPSKILHFLGIKSPPQWAIDAGKHIINGVGIGMQQAQASFAKASAAAGAAAATSLGSGGAGALAGGPGVRRWAPTVVQALKLAGLSPTLRDAVLYQMQTESGGNPTIVNKWDSNWKAGHPSVGLMQVIDSTFRTFAGRFRSTGPFEYGVSVNPLANIYAALKYAEASYGPGLRNAEGGIGTGHGYAYGTGSAIPGWAWVGEGGPELLRFRGGEQVRPAPDAHQLHLRHLHHLHEEHLEHLENSGDLAAEIRGLRGQMERLIQVAAAIPARTGQHVAAGVNSAAAGGSFRRRYPS